MAPQRKRPERNQSKGQGPTTTGPTVVDQEQAGPRIEAVSAKNPCASQGIQSGAKNDKSPKRARATPGQQHQQSWPKSGVDPQPNLSKCGVRPQPTFRQTPPDRNAVNNPSCGGPSEDASQPETSYQSQSSRKQPQSKPYPRTVPVAYTATRTTEEDDVQPVSRKVLISRTWPPKWSLICRCNQ